MKTLKTIFTSFLFFTITTFSFADDKLSDFTQKKINEFLDMRIELKSETHTFAVEKIAEIWKDTFSELKDNAINYEQESLILESLYYMETFERGNTKSNRTEMRAKMKDLMLRNFSFIEKNDKENVNSWIFLVTGDVTSYYMTRSIPATFHYGMKVKSFYETAIEKNSMQSGALVSLGNWYFYAPGIFGGSNKKAEKCYKSAIRGAKTNGERYLAYEFLSQLYYEQKKVDDCASYLKKARELNLGYGELDFVENCNKKGMSLYQYNRNKAGIDEEMSEDEKDEDDKRK